MTLDEMEAREAKYQEMMTGIMNGTNVSHILGSDWVFGLPFTAKKAPFIARANEMFVKLYGDVTQFCSHSHIS